MRLFHFSDEADIEVFVPRPVRTPSERGPGREWLNGPLVWAIEAQRQAMYLFPRECPRILAWATPRTSPADQARWFGGGPAKTLAYVEYDWLDRVRAGALYRYEFDLGGFESLEDAGMWVSRRTERPVGCEKIDDLVAALRSQAVELRVVESLSPLRGLWDTSLHVSGVRLRNAKGWSR
jgi:hypothetical protein